MVINFAFQPGILDYWMLLSDWRNGSFAILLALTVLFIGYVLATRNQIPAPEGPHVPRGGATERTGPDGMPLDRITEWQRSRRARESSSL
jgi:hypothetical protein